MSLLLTISHYNFADIDECASGAHVCSDVALCLNTPGSYNCSCLDGYDGDGFNCTGALLVDRRAGLIAVQRGVLKAEIM